LLFYRVCLQIVPDVHKVTKSRAKVLIRIILRLLLLLYEWQSHWQYYFNVIFYHY